MHRILLLFGRNVKFKRGTDSLYEVEEISRRGDGKSRVCNKDGVGGRGKITADANTMHHIKDTDKGPGVRQGFWLQLRQGTVKMGHTTFNDMINYRYHQFESMSMGLQEIHL